MKKLLAATPFLLALASCKLTPAARAAKVADGITVFAGEANSVLEARCVRGAKEALDLPALEKLEAICTPLIASYDALRLAHVTLRAALVSYEAAKDAGAPAEVLARMLEQIQTLSTELLRTVDSLQTLLRPDPARTRQ